MVELTLMDNHMRIEVHWEVSFKCNWRPWLL